MGVLGFISTLFIFGVIMIYRDDIWDFFSYGCGFERVDFTTGTRVKREIPFLAGSRAAKKNKDLMDNLKSQVWIKTRQVDGIIAENVELSNRLNLMHIENSKLEDEISKLKDIAHIEEDD